MTMEEKMTATDYKKSKARRRRKKERMFLKHLISLWQIGHNRWVEVPVAGFNKDGEWESDKNEIEHYRRWWRGKRSKQIKKNCNRRLRRTSQEVYQNGEYKKATEFWWELD